MIFATILSKSSSDISAGSSAASSVAVRDSLSFVKASNQFDAVREASRT